MQTFKDLKFDGDGGIPWMNQGCGKCGGCTWMHPTNKCKKFVNTRENWEMAKASSEFDSRYSGTGR